MATLSTIITPTNIITATSTTTLTNKTINGSSNTLTNVSLSTAVTGTLPAANGGTGLTSPGTAGNVLVSDGTAWTSTAPAASGAPVGSLQYFSGTTAPDSTWLYCSGEVFAKSTYTALSNAIGTLPNRFTTVANGGVSTSGSDVGAASPIVSNGTSFYAYALLVNCGSYSNVAYTSTNGTTWTTSGVSSPGRGPQDLIYSSADSIFVALLSDIGYPSSTNELRTSTNFSTWTSRTVTTSLMRTVRYLNSLYVVGGNGGFLATSTDAITWTSRTSGTSSTIYALSYGNGVYVYAGEGGVAATSTDAITWTSRTTGTTSDITNLAYGNNTFVAVGASYNGTSTDGITWATTGNDTSFGAENNLYFLDGTFWSRNSSNVSRYSSTGKYWATYTTQTTTNMGTSTNRVIYGRFGSFSVLSQIQFFVYNPFTYATSTQFCLPTQALTQTTQNGVTEDNLGTLFVKAS